MKASLPILSLALFHTASAADLSPIENKGIYTTLLQLVNDTSAEQLIDENAPVTIFGPKDTAFSVLSSLFEGYTVEELAAVLLDHVVAGEVITSAMIVEKGCIEAETVGGLKLALKFDPVASSVTANNIPITDFNIDSDFGTMHGMEGVLLEGILGAFEPCPKPPILDPIVAKGSYNTLIDFLIDTNSVGTLEANAPMTIFGPKDSAFAAISNTTDTLSTEQLQAVILDHVILGELIDPNTVISQGCIERETVGGLKVGILFDPDTSILSINNVTISDFNIAGDYGMFNGIDEVLVEGVQGDFVPCPPFEADFNPIRKRSIYLGLVNALATTGAAAEVSANAPVTIFGPNDISFGSVAGIVNDYTKEELADLVLKHTIVGGAIAVSDIVEAGCIDKVTLGGINIAMRYNSTLDQIDVNGIIVNDYEIRGDYGVMHGMQGVLLDSSGYVKCPTPSFVDQIIEKGNYTSLVTFLAISDLIQQEFARAGPVTVFGPDDGAFSEIASDLIEADETQMVTTLGGHVVQTVFTSAKLTEMGCVILRTVIGSTIRVMYLKDEDVIMVNDAKVILPNIADDISIFHGIDKVLDAGEQFECPQTPEPTRAPSPPVFVPTPQLSSAPRFGSYLALALSATMIAALAL